MQDLIFFLGRFHVLALHLPIGMLVAAVALDWLARSPRRAALAPAVPWVWGATALSAVLTVVLGYLHFSEGGFTGASAAAHRLYGTLVALACIAVWLLSAKRPQLHRRLNVVTGVVLLALVTVTGHYGGNLTHGAEYLVEYAPQPLRALAGLPERRAPVSDLAAADPWRDIVEPMLDARCASCHNADKRSGELSVVDYESLMRGGETGRVVSAGDSQVSELMHRITLPPDDEAFMPAEGQTPLTSDQIEILRWWIDAGAPVDTTVAALGTTADIEAKLRVEVGLDASAADSAVAPAEAASDPALVDALFEAGSPGRECPLGRLGTGRRAARRAARRGRCDRRSRSARERPRRCGARRVRSVHAARIVAAQQKCDRRRWRAAPDCAAAVTCAQHLWQRVGHLGCGRRACADARSRALVRLGYESRRR